MPGDKISGQNKFDGTFLNIVTPFISPVRAMSYNFFLPYRAVDNTFYKGMVPTKLNQMSANWSTPLFNTRAIIDKLVNSYLLYFDPYISEFYGAPVQPILSFLAKASVSQVSFKNLSQRTKLFRMMSDILMLSFMVALFSTIMETKKTVLLV